ncbi:hypothetical protein M3Y99_00473300 [Aphelenchoides fujianensis]|nr:hypothetical protein M3Y99_00473300 [Aphelenchoides fujianensis]
MDDGQSSNGRPSRRSAQGVSKLLASLKPSPSTAKKATTSKKQKAAKNSDPPAVPVEIKQEESTDEKSVEKAEEKAEEMTSKRTPKPKAPATPPPPSRKPNGTPAGSKAAGKAAEDSPEVSTDASSPPPTSEEKGKAGKKSFSFLALGRKCLDAKDSPTSARTPKRLSTSSSRSSPAVGDFKRSGNRSSPLPESSAQSEEKPEDGPAHESQGEAPAPAAKTDADDQPTSTPASESSSFVPAASLPHPKADQTDVSLGESAGGRKRRLASAGVSKATSALKSRSASMVGDFHPAALEPRRKPGRPPLNPLLRQQRAQQKAANASFTAGERHLLMSVLESPTEPAAKRPHLEAHSSSFGHPSGSNEASTSSFQPLQISTMEGSSLNPFAPPPTPFTPSPAGLVGVYDPQGFQQALHEQNQIYAKCDQLNQRRMSLGGNRPHRNKARPLSEFAPELMRNRTSAAQKQQQQLQRLFKRQQATARKAEMKRIKEQKRLQRLARKTRAAAERLVRKRTADAAGFSSISTDFTSNDEDSSGARRLGRPLHVSVDSDGAGLISGRRDSRSVSSPAIFGRRYAAFGTQQTEPAAPLSSASTAQSSRKKPTADGKAEPPAEEEVDVVGDGDTLRAPTIAKLVAAMPDEEADEVLVRNPADECVADIRKLLPLREQSAASEEEDSEPAAASPMDRLQQAVEQFECPLLKEHLRVLLPAVVGQRGADLTTLGVVGGCSVFYARSLANATRLRQRLMLFSHKRLQAIEEAHSFLLHRLSNEFLASYLNLLRFLKISGSNLAVHLVENAKEPAVRKANDCVRDFISTKVTDPNLRFGRATSDITPLPNVSLVLVYPQVAMEGQTVNKHAHENMFRNLLPAAVKCVEKVELRFDLVTDIRTLVHLCLDLVRRRVKELVKRRPDDHVFLAGWGISTLINMQALQKVAGVAGVLNFAYPMRSPLGFRGTVDDSTCITYCASLFVVGDAGMNVNLQELQTMRKNMICDSGVIVVGGADDHLYVSPLFLSVERVSQHCVDRMILDHVVDFMKLVISEGGMSARAKRQHLVPVKMPNPFDVDLSTLKGRASGFVPKARPPPKQSSSGALPVGSGSAKKRNDSHTGNPSGRSSPSTAQHSPLSASSEQTAGFSRQLPPHSAPPRSSASSSFLGLKTAGPRELGTSTAPSSAAPLLTGASSSRAGRSGTEDARHSFNSLLHRRSSVAVCMHEPKMPIDFSTPLTTTVAPSVRRESAVLPPPSVPVRAAPPASSQGSNADEQQMRAEAEAAVASLGAAFPQADSEEIEDSAF